MIKRFLKYFLIVILFSAWGIILTNQEQTREVAQEVYRKVVPPCSRPLEYSIGSVDPKFGVTSQQLRQLAAEAAGTWNKASERQLFQYNPSSDFKINLVYDQRQEKTQAAAKLEQNLSALESTHDALENQYDSLNASYKKKIDAYNRNLEEYKSDLEKYNEEVDYWNERGGAPKDEYEKLQDEKDDLKDQYADLEKERKEVNALANQTNSVAQKENMIASSYNNSLATYKNRYGDSREFEKGVFDGQEINIYQFKEASDLKLTLVHELGHYLGLGHIDNPESIMYYLLGEQDMENITLTKEDVNELNKVCRL